MIIKNDLVDNNWLHFHLFLRMTSSAPHDTSESTNSSATDTPVTMGLPIGKQFKVYLKVVGMGSLSTIVLIFCVFSIFWGSLYKMPARKLPGWIVVCSLLFFCFILVTCIPGLRWRFDWPECSSRCNFVHVQDQLDSCSGYSILKRSSRCRGGLRWKDMVCYYQWEFTDNWLVFECFLTCI